tara:strand:+ start:3139 stop:3246 length:108 start_codon:yes stop_codon:yes gene_type:complete
MEINTLDGRSYSKAHHGGGGAAVGGVGGDVNVPSR